MDLAGGAASQHSQCDEREGVRILEGSLEMTSVAGSDCEVTRRGEL